VVVPSADDDSGWQPGALPGPRSCSAIIPGSGCSVAGCWSARTGARAAARQLCARIPLALRLRGVPDRRLERCYRTLAAFERSRGRHDASPGVLSRSPSGRTVRAAVTEHGR
jgi:hypothetical protein